MMGKDVFVYHLDNELQKLFALNHYNSHDLYSKFCLITKVAFLICKNKILIPASNFFESDISFKILNDLKELNEIGAVSLICSSQNIEELLAKKVYQHEENLSAANFHYKDFIDNDNIILPGNLTKRENSASKDIKKAWYQFIADPMVEDKLFSFATNNIGASEFEDLLYEIPHNLRDKAYISDYIVPLLPIEKYNIYKTDYYINTLITRSYIASFLDEFNSACLTDIPFIDSKTILPENSDGKYCYISYSDILRLLKISKYNNRCSLEFLLGCNAYELIEFKYSATWTSILEQITPTVSSSKFKTERVGYQDMDDYSDVKIGIITALPKECAAMKLMMSDTKECFFEGKGAGHRFYVGKISSANGKKHRVALGLCGMGNNNASIRATNMLSHFKAIEELIMTGIAGGIPSYQNDDKQVRLGDIVVSKSITQYDFVKETPTNIECRSNSAKPSAKLLEAVQFLEVDKLDNNCTWEKYISQFANNEYSKPEIATDVIYDIYDNVYNPPNDRTRTQYPRVFEGNIASANDLLKDPKKRNNLKKEFNVIAVEMEGSGIADTSWNHEIGYIVVRGICDYCDTHKNDIWQKYAALVAAAYTRSLIEKLPKD